jgi:hypothetical protein
MLEKGGRDGVARLDSTRQLLRRGEPGEDWLQRSLRNLYQSVVDEPVPQELIDIVARIAELDSSTTGSSNPARQNNRPEEERARAQRCEPRRWKFEPWQIPRAARRPAARLANWRTAMKSWLNKPKRDAARARRKIVTRADQGVAGAPQPN